MSKILTVLFASLLIVSCSKKKSSDPDMVTYDVTIETNNMVSNDSSSTGSGSQKLSPELQEMKDKINSKQPVSFKKLTNLYIDEHVASSKYIKTEMKDDGEGKSVVTTNHGQLLSDLSSFITVASAGVSKQYFSQKSIYEKTVETRAGKQLVYNRDAVTLKDVELETKLQCFSGTALNLAVSRTVYTGHEYRGQNLVVVFSRGHVSPGQMVSIQGKWHLFEVETTQSGDAVNYYGMASSVYDRVVIDAELFVLSEIFKNEMTIEQQVTLRDSIIQKTADKYGLPKDILSKMTSSSGSTGLRVSGGGSSNSENDPFNSSLFSFGDMQTPAGDQPRTQGGSAQDAIQLINDLNKPQTGMSVQMIEEKPVVTMDDILAMSCEDFMDRYSAYAVNSEGYSYRREYSPNCRIKPYARHYDAHYEAYVYWFGVGNHEIGIPERVLGLSGDGESYH